MVETKLLTVDLAVGTFRNTCFVFWRRNTTVLGLSQLRRVLEAFEASNSTGWGVLTLVPTHAPPPDGDARKAMAEMFGAVKQLKASALWCEGTGLRATLVRSVVTGVYLLARQPFPHKVFASLDESAAFIASSMELEKLAHPSAAEVARVFASWREGLASAPLTVERAAT